MQELEAALIQQIESKSCQKKTEKSSTKGYDEWQRRFEKKKKKKKKNNSQKRDCRPISLLILSEIKQVNYFLFLVKSSKNLRKTIVF